MDSSLGPICQLTLPIHPHSSLPDQRAVPALLNSFSIVTSQTKKRKQSNTFQTKAITLLLQPRVEWLTPKKQKNDPFSLLSKESVRNRPSNFYKSTILPLTLSLSICANGEEHKSLIYKLTTATLKPRTKYMTHAGPVYTGLDKNS